MTPDNMTVDGWEAWFFHPGTIAFFQRTKEHREQLEQSLAAGRTVVPESMEQTAMLTAKITGEIEGLDYVLKHGFLRKPDDGDEEG